MVNLLLFFVLSIVFSSEKAFVSKVGEQIRVSVSQYSGKFVAVYEDTNCGKPEKHICLNVGGAEELADDSFVSTAFPSVGVDSSGNIYVVFSDARAIDPSTGQRTWDIYLRKKVGNNWTASERINSKTTSDQCGISGDQINPDIAVSSSGIYIVWQSIDSRGRSSICFVHSPDFGNTWNPNKKLGEGYHPSIAVSGSNIYIVFSDINGNVNFLSSNDGGNSFSLRSSPIHVAAKRILDLSAPDISVSPTGTILVVFQDSVNKDGTEDVDVFITSSKDGGGSWSEPENLDLPGDQTNPSVVYNGGIFIFFTQNNDVYYVEAKGNVSVSAGEFSPTGILEVESGLKDVAVFQLKLTTSPELGEAEIKTIRFKASGTFNDSVHISKVKLFHDTDGNGVISSGTDPLLGEGIFSADDSYVSLPVNKIISSSPLYLILAVDLAKPIPRDSTFSVSIDPPSDVLATLPSSSVGVSVTGPVLSSAQIKVKNNAPVAELSAEPTSVLEGSETTVLLDGSSSYDPDGDALSFSWEQISGPPVSLNISGSTASFTAPSSVTRNETLSFRLTVSDSFGGVSTSTVSVVVVDSLNEPPVAEARVNIGGNLFSGPVEVNEGDTVILDASESYDPNGDSIFYFWTKLSGPEIEINNPYSVTASFVAPEVIGSSQDVLKINLSVRDSKGATSSDTIEIRVRNTKDDPPVAKFTANPLRGAVPLTVSFDASASFDYDGSVILYSWDFGDGSVIDTNSPTITHTYNTPGEYNVVLKVIDSGGNSSTASLSIFALSSVPTLFILANQLETRVPFGALKDIVSIKISNVSEEDIFLGSLDFSLEGVPDAIFDFFIDENSDQIKDRRVFSFNYSTTSSVVFSVPLNVNIQPGKSVILFVSSVLNPVYIPATYKLSLNGISSKGVVSGVEPDILGLTFPYTVTFSVTKPALVFSAPSTFGVISGDKVPFFINVSGNGGTFTISSFVLEYDPTKILSLTIFDDINKNGLLDSSDVVLGNISGGSQKVNLSLTVSGTKSIGFYVYPVQQASSPILFYASLVFPFALIFMRRKILSIVIVFLILLSFMTCANKPGTSQAVSQPTQKQPSKQQPGEQQPGQGGGQEQIDFSKYRITKFRLVGVELSSAPSDYDVVGLPLEIYILY